MAQLLERLGSGWEYVGELVGGSEGAALVTRPDGSQAVLKTRLGLAALEAEQLRVRRVQILRGAGVPLAAEAAPRVCGETLVLLSDYVEGLTPIGPLTQDFLEQILRISEQTAGLADDDETEPWAGWLNRSLTIGMDGWSRPSVVLADLRCRSLGERAIRWADQAAAASPAKDMLHGDFHPGNILHRGGHIELIVDCGAVRPGDRYFDLLTLLWVSASTGAQPGVRERLRLSIETGVPSQMLQVMTAHFVIRLLDWALTYAPQLLEELIVQANDEFDLYGM